MKVRELIHLLCEFDSGADVVIEDLNGLHWDLDLSLVGVDDDGTVVIGSKDINVV